MEDMEDHPQPSHGITNFSTDPVKKLEEELPMKIWTQTKMELQFEKRKIYNIIWGQCTEVLIARLKSTSNYKTLSKEANPIELLKEIGTLQFHQSEKSIMLQQFVQWKTNLKI